jgi:Aminoglycoside adenylyltransferase, C-terminal domain/Nucleotidyltransferase domain
LREERAELELARQLAALIQGALGDELLGLYLYGSYVSGGFDPGVSDLDMVAVTSREVRSLDLAALERMHADFDQAHPSWKDRIEVVYIDAATLRSFRTSTGRLAVISPGEPFHVRADPPIEWLQNWYLVRETAVPLHGPAANSIIPPIEWSEFVQAAVRYAGQLASLDPRRMGPGLRAYTVLTASRALRTVETQSLGSKQEAAAWTSRQMPQWAWLLDRALACRLSGGSVGFDDARTVAAAEEFVRQVNARIGGISRPAIDAPGGP